MDDFVVVENEGPELDADAWTCVHVNPSANAGVTINSNARTFTDFCKEIDSIRSSGTDLPVTVRVHRSARPHADYEAVIAAPTRVNLYNLKFDSEIPEIPDYSYAGLKYASCPGDKISAFSNWLRMHSVDLDQLTITHRITDASEIWLVAQQVRSLYIMRHLVVDALLLLRCAKVTRLWIASCESALPCRFVFDKRLHIHSFYALTPETVDNVSFGCTKLICSSTIMSKLNETKPKRIVHVSHNTSNGRMVWYPDSDLLVTSGPFIPGFDCAVVRFDAPLAKYMLYGGGINHRLVSNMKKAQCQRLEVYCPYYCHEFIQILINATRSSPASILCLRIKHPANVMTWYKSDQKWIPN